MSIPNLLALLLLSGTVVRLTKEFFASEADCPQQKEAAARQLSKNIVRNPELFQGQNGSKRFRVFDFSQFPRAGCYRFFQSPYSARVRLFSTRTVHVTIYIRNKK